MQLVLMEKAMIENNKLYDFNESLHNNANYLTREYSKLEHIIEHCNKLSNNLLNSIGPTKTKINSLQSTLNYFIHSNSRSFTSNILKNITRNKDDNSYVSIFGKFAAKMLSGARASGGNISQGNPYLVGEKGPEVFVPNQSGYIIPNHQLTSNKPINIVMNVSTTDAQSFQKSQNQIFSQAIRAMQKARKNF